MGKKVVASGGDNGPNTIYKVRSPSIVLLYPIGAPVYEMVCRDVAVMRRRVDAYLNATQILKVAGFDKPQRTRVLEREVQKGEHEKVQGGYGKYQGTWIPIERGLALAKQYGVEDLLRPIIDYVPSSVSPPPAPKHSIAPPSKSRQTASRSKATPSKTGPQSAAALQAQAQLSRSRIQESTPDADTSFRSLDDRLSMTLEDDSSSDTPSPVASALNDDGMNADVDMHMGMPLNVTMPNNMDDITSSSRKRSAAMMMEDEDHYAQLRSVRGASAVHTPQDTPRHIGMGVPEEPLGPEQYTDIILNYFVSETSQIPSILVTPPRDFDPNAPIDDDGHTALHWACAMGRVRVVKLLLTAGASIFAGNNAEQTPLMRSVMFSNNYDMRKFPELYELLHRSTLNIDKQNRTVFHHIANLALTKGKTHAAKYYMETILARLADYPQELADVINFQDEEGETALTIAARARSRRLVKALLDHGANPKIKNRDMRSAEDYILEDERFRSSPVPGANGSSKAFAAASAASVEKPLFAPQLYFSEAARLCGGQSLSNITSHMQSLARSFDAELQGKERDILQAKALLTSIHAEVIESGRSISSISTQTAPLDDKRRKVESLQLSLQSKIKQNLKKGYILWLEGELSREQKVLNGEIADNDEERDDVKALTTLPTGGVEVIQAEEEKLRWEIEEKRKRRAELVERFIKAQTEAGTSDQIAKYRKLISAGLGGVYTNEVDELMNQLLESLEDEGDNQTYPQEDSGSAPWTQK
nr:transcription factor [Cryptococcus depauperatus CBS 7855]